MLFVCLLLCAALSAQPVPDSLRTAVTLYAGFDGGTDAEIARGDGRIYSAPSYDEQGSAKPGFGDVPVQIAGGEGLAGDALRFTGKNTKALFYKAEGNVAYRESSFSGTVSFWLKLNPDEDLAPGYCDPIQITDDAYNDSAFWVDFTKDERPRHFRMGVFGDLEAWNPENEQDSPKFEARLVVVRRPPFSRDRWTHVVIVWSGLNGGESTAELYLNARRIGEADGIRERFTWDLERAAVRLGVNYVGLFDELTVFNTPLSQGEVEDLYEAQGGK